MTYIEKKLIFGVAMTFQVFAEPIRPADSSAGALGRLRRENGIEF